MTILLNFDFFKCGAETLKIHPKYFFFRVCWLMGRSWDIEPLLARWAFSLSSLSIIFFQSFKRRYNRLCYWELSYGSLNNKELDLLWHQKYGRITKLPLTKSLKTFRHNQKASSNKTWSKHLSKLLRWSYFSENRENWLGL